MTDEEFRELPQEEQNKIVAELIKLSVLLALCPHIPAMTFINGGIIVRPSFGLMKGHENARNNPEVIPPLAKLREIIKKNFKEGGETFES